MAVRHIVKLDLYGTIPRDGWQIVAPGPSLDYAALLAALSEMPGAGATVIHAWHLLNKLTSDQQIELLQECRRVLAPGGVFAGSVPDMDVLCRLFVSLPDPIPRMAIATAIYGNHASPAEINHFGFNPDLLMVAFGNAGYRKISLIDAPTLPDLPATVIDGIPADLNFVAEA